MSHHYGYYCATCKEQSETWFNHGEGVLGAIQKAMPVIKTLQATALMKDYWQLELKWPNVYDLPNPVDWLLQHEGHDISISDGYSNQEV